MTDVHTKAQRSHNMSCIKGRDTKPEILLRKSLWHLGYRYSLNNNSLPGNPDLALKKYNVVIFVDGCFWHRCPKHFKQPANNAKFWRKKIQSNVDRDKKNNGLLKKQGWVVLRIWEHDIEKRITKITKRLANFL